MFEILGILFVILIVIWLSVWFLLSSIVLLFSRMPFNDKLKMSLLYLMWPLFSFMVHLRRF